MGIDFSEPFIRDEVCLQYAHYFLPASQFEDIDSDKYLIN